MAPPTHWTSFGESPFPWERDALDFVRAELPAREPFRAWSLFEFIALDGSVNEVDLLVYAPYGFFLIEIKSHPGTISGDGGTWLWENDGRRSSFDNPLKLANLKAKRLAGLLGSQNAFRRGSTKVPYIEPLVFLSAPQVNCNLTGTGRLRVCLRDVGDRTAASSSAQPARAGIIAAICQRNCPGLQPLTGRPPLDRPTAKLVTRAIDEAGIRQSQRQRRVSDYILDEQIDDGPAFQDWIAHHASLPDVKRRIRIFPLQGSASAEARQRHQRAAIRDYQLQESLRHDRVLRALQYTDHELGPAIIFEHDPAALRLDHFLAERDSDLTFSTRLDLVRQLAEVMQFAHEKRVVHRSLSPRSVLITAADSPRPRVKVFNWQTGYQAAADMPGGSQGITATSHVAQLVDDPTTAYMAPDMLVADADTLGEHLDVFSLGAVAYHLLSGQPPAADGSELAGILREAKGLQLAGVVDSASSGLCELIRYATHPDVSQRLDSLEEFLLYLDAAEEELTSPEDVVDNPAEAQAGDLLDGGWVVIRRLGQGSCAVALLVRRSDGGNEKTAPQFILKAASAAEHNERVRAEAEVLEQLASHRDKRIVEYVDTAEIGVFQGFLMRPAYSDRSSRRIETLGGRLRKQGRLNAELLERFGADLIGVAAVLDRLGITHRDIKPDNIAIGSGGPDDALQLVLFDFSLVSTPRDNIRAGTPGYLDPLLPLRPAPPRYDNFAERYAVAATLYEMATGTLPRFGDGRSDPSQIDDEITIDPDLFDAGTREPLAAFFRRCFRRDLAERFDNAEQMLTDWQACFTAAGTAPRPSESVADRESDVDDEADLRSQLATATLDTPIAELRMGTRATGALDRANVLLVRDLLAFNRRRLDLMPGVGAKTRGEIIATLRILRERLAPEGLPPAPTAATPAAPAADTTPSPPPEAAPADVRQLSLDDLASRLFAPLLASSRGESTRRVIDHLLGRGAAAPLASPWPTQSAIAEQVGITRARVGQIFRKLLTAAGKDAALIAFRDDLVALLEGLGGVATADELATALVAGRGSDLDTAPAERLALGLLRIAAEAEGLLAEPAIVTRREAESVLIGLSDDLTDYAVRLGKAAASLIDTAAEEPLPSPDRVVERLQRITAPPSAGLSATRLVRLAAAASATAAVSSRLELYPRGMSSLRALKLSLGAVSGLRQLSEADLRGRVTSRYPAAEPLPARPALDDLLRRAGLHFSFDPQAAGGRGGYRAPDLIRPSVTTGSTFQSRYATALPSASAGPASSRFAAARSLEARLTRGLRDGSFLQMSVAEKYYSHASDELLRRFDVDRVDVEAIVLAALDEMAAEKNVDWSRIEAADASPGSGDWSRLTRLVNLCRPAIAQRLFTPGRTPLLLYADILVRYGLKNMLADLQAAIGTAAGPHGVWLLVPGGEEPLLDGEPTGVPGQKAVVPTSWVLNAHRSELAASP